MRFKNKVIIITGATSGIGAATADMFVKEGAKVILIGRNQERGSDIQKRLADLGNVAPDFECCDVTDPDAVRNLRRIVEKRYGRTDVLFNNAGIFITSDLKDLDFNDWDDTFNTNVNGVLYMTKFFLDLLTSVHGNIINNASVSGLDCFTNGAKAYMYGTSKAAVIKFSKLCALNYANDIRVNVICPGVIDTEIFTNRDFSRFDGKIPMGYVGKPEMIAETVLFLASEMASYITGAVIPIDGGMSLT